ncbi:hypothetical protein Sango_1910500 [Sesamum angolense]|uniref:Uncharacterized protein n=1 Tax=Sesamum angolense TaxID=2727404 RepID=A0AAE2BQS4_9LAMI|nr:hypothetical protein Sango_1910500 [Sesamum angolense]
MLYWKYDIDMEYCKFCGDHRYKPTRDRIPRRKKSPYAVLRYLSLTRRLQRLYASPATADHITWHASHVTEEDSMCHSSDAKVWRHFDRTYPDFTLKPHHVRLGLCIDRFAPHWQYGRTYSYWPVIITPYNLLPECVYGCTIMPQNQAFIMRVALMWIVNELPAYGMAYGWSIAGIMGYPICMDDTSAFYLQHDQKACYFDWHRRFLPQDHPYQRNKKAFIKNRQERNIARPRLIGEEIRVRMEEYSNPIKQPLVHPPGYGTEHKWAKKNIFYIGPRT